MGLMIAITWVLQVSLTNWLIDGMGTSHVSPHLLVHDSRLMEGSTSP
jgi:hypothetical protein